MECARTGNADAVAALLKAGARVNETEAVNQQTALMWAVAQQHPKVVQALLEGGADIRARSRTYPQIVETGNRGGGGDISTVLRGGSTPLLFAARVGDVESARLLIAAGADVNDALPDGVSALVLAAHSGHGALGALLLEKGANPNAAEAGFTALHAAIDRSDLSLVQALLASWRESGYSSCEGHSGQTRQQRFSTGFTAHWLDPVSIGCEICRG